MVIQEEEEAEAEPKEAPTKKKKEADRARLSENPPTKKKRASKVRALLLGDFWSTHYSSQGSTAAEPPKKKSKVSIDYVRNNI